jgi:hypothetical protein
MDEIAPLSQVNAVTGTRSLRRIIIGVAIYVGAFVILAPMMQ